MFQAAGAYAASAVSLGPDTGINSFQRYVFGASWPFPLPLLAAAAVRGLLALAVGLFSLRRIRRDYQAAILLIVSLVAIGLVSNVIGLVNGSNGLTGIPSPWPASCPPELRRLPVGLCRLGRCDRPWQVPDCRAAGQIRVGPGTARGPRP